MLKRGKQGVELGERDTVGRFERFDGLYAGGENLLERKRRMPGRNRQHLLMRDIFHRSTGTAGALPYLSTKLRLLKQLTNVQRLSPAWRVPYEACRQTRMRSISGRFCF